MTRPTSPKGPIAWMANNPVAANLLMLSLIAGGIIISFRVRQEVRPSIEPDRVGISVAYPGAGPAEVEQGILLSIEDALKTMDNVKEIRTTANEGLGTVSIEMEYGSDMGKALTDAKNAVDRITSFPNEAEKPVVQIPAFRNTAIWLVLYGNQDKRVLKKLAERARDELLSRPEISYVELQGTKRLEIGVEIPLHSLRTYGITLSQVAAKIRNTALESPAGGVKTKGGEVLLRTAERRNLGSDFADIPIVTGADGNSLRLRDIASIDDSFEESDYSVTFEGKNVVWLQVSSIGTQSPPKVAEAVKDYALELQDRLPPGVQITTWRDRSEVYKGRRDLLLNNSVIALVLVLVVLGLFLEPKIAFWVTLGIPVSFLGSFILLPAFGVSFNMLSMFAFIIVLGMVVDDAIVVGENTFRLQRQGVPIMEAAIRGARQVSMPVVFSICTTIVAFSPILFVPGVSGQIMYAIPVIVILVLLLSLVESFLILPAHLSHFSKAKTKGVIAFLTRKQQRFSILVERFIDRFYVPLVKRAINQRWITISLSVAILIATIGLMTSGRLKIIFFPVEESDWIIVDAELPFGVPIDQTKEVMKRIVEAGHKTMADHGGDRINRGTMASVGKSGTHTTTIRTSLVPSSERDISSNDFAAEWRENLGDIPNLRSLTFDSSTGLNSKPVDFELSHEDPRTLESAAKRLAMELESFTGLRDIEDGIQLGKAQLDFTVSEEGESAGLTSLDLARQVRSAFFGAEALRQQRGRDEIRVMVRLPRSERESLSYVEEMIINTPGGGEMTLRKAADIKRGRAYTAINRVDGKRITRVKAAVTSDKVDANKVETKVLENVLPKIAADYPGLTFESAGMRKNLDEFFEFLLVGFLMALMFNYCLIAIPLKSYIQPLSVVIIVIPFGFIGAIFGHLFLGMNLSIMSWLGIVALSGVVVNDSIVYVDSANRFRRRGLDPVSAAVDAARRRFRPIVLTSLTTFVGLTPIIAETSVQANMVKPMAVSLGFGILISTFFILLLVPTLFVITEIFRIWTVQRKGEPAGDDIDALGAGKQPLAEKTV